MPTAIAKIHPRCSGSYGQAAQGACDLGTDSFFTPVHRKPTRTHVSWMHATSVLYLHRWIKSRSELSAACHIRNSGEAAGTISRHGGGSCFRVFFISRRRLGFQAVAPKKSISTFPLPPFVPAERSKSSTYACGENPAAAAAYSATRSASF